MLEILVLCALLLFIAQYSVVKSATDEKSEVGTSKPPDNLEKENITIRPWQYCESCKAIVQLYGKLSAEEMKNMQKNGVKFWKLIL